MMNEEFWEDLYQVDARDAWINAGYDENGEAAACDVCGDEIRFDENERCWVCPGCGQRISRPQWFQYIGAEHMPGPKCLSMCKENYPICKRWCRLYRIPANDPML